MGATSASLSSIRGQETTSTSAPGAVWGKRSISLRAKSAPLSGDQVVTTTPSRGRNFPAGSSNFPMIRSPVTLQRDRILSVLEGRRQQCLVVLQRDIVGDRIGRSEQDPPSRGDVLNEVPDRFVNIPGSAARESESEVDV